MGDTTMSLDEIERTSRDVLPFSISFLRLSVHQGQEGIYEDADPAGSGTLVRIGPLFGVLTAAHVLKGLPPKPVGLVRVRGAGIVQRLTVDMANAEYIAFGGDGKGYPDGPDIGFLLLPHDVVSSLQATNSFFDIGARVADYRDRLEERPYTRVLLGALAERTSKLTTGLPFYFTKNVQTFPMFGRVTSPRDANGYDIFDFVPTYAPGASAADVPESYEGMSGGGLWHVAMQRDEAGHRVISRTLQGVVYWETPDPGTERRVICHGPMSVYERLVPAIKERWPKAFGARQR